MLRIITIIALVALPLPAIAQQAADGPATRCYLAGKAFSPGSTIRAASTVTVCGADGSWTATDKPAAGCFLNDNFYSVGGSAAGADKTIAETCGGDGSWTTKAAP